MSEHKRIGRNMGRVELLAVRNTVTAMLEACYDRKKIHSRLKAEGRPLLAHDPPKTGYDLERLSGSH